MNDARPSGLQERVPYRIPESNICFIWLPESSEFALACCFDLMTKAEIKAAIQETEQRIMALEKRHPEQEMRPWCANDHPVALEHWGLIQRRIRLQEELKRPAYSAERRLAQAERMRHRYRPADKEDFPIP